MCTCVGVGQRVGFPLDAAGCTRVLVDLLHRVEVYGVDPSQSGQADLVLPILVGRLKKNHMDPNVRSEDYYRSEEYYS